MGISFPQEKHRGVKITPLAQGPGGKDTLAIKNLVHFQRGLYQLYQLYQLYHLYCCSSSYIKRGALTGLSPGNLSAGGCEQAHGQGPLPANGGAGSRCRRYPDDSRLFQAALGATRLLPGLAGDLPPDSSHSHADPVVEQYNLGRSTLSGTVSNTRRYGSVVDVEPNIFRST